MNDFGNCKICGQEEARCKSHIIPRNFYKRILAGGKGVDAYDQNFQKQGPHLQSGWWEQGILCSACDRMIGNFDEYAYKVLPAGLRGSQIIKDPISPLKAFILEPINVRHFKLFLVSLLWRMHVSKHSFFRLVDLGFYEERFLEILRKPREFSEIPVEAILVHFIPPFIDKALISSTNQDLEGIATVLVLVPPWKLIVKIDDRAFPERWDALRIQEDKPILGLIQDRPEGAEFDLVMEIVQRGKALEVDKGH